MHVFLAALPAVCAVRECSIACLTNLREVTITDFSTGAGSKLRCPVVVEPAFLALGTHHLAVGLDCKVCLRLQPIQDSAMYGLFCQRGCNLPASFSQSFVS